jgi:hypothetical protein
VRFRELGREGELPTVKIDLVTRHAAGDTYSLILVEEGPWPGQALSQELHRVQDRLNDVLDAVLQGVVAQRFPETNGRHIVIRLDGYGLPDAPVGELCSRFADHVQTSSDVRAACGSSAFASSLRFEFSLSPLPQGPPPQKRSLPWWKRLFS